VVPPPAGLYAVSIESGRRAAAEGGHVCYDLFVPRPDPALPPPPWPALVLTHGFARNRGYQRNNAIYLAQRGIIVMTPDMSSLLGGERSQLGNIADLVGDVAWLADRSTAPGDPLAGLLDPARIALAGHSAGGAVAFEAAIDSFAAATPVAAVALLDAVPWGRTIDRAPEFPAIPLASWRSEPSSCNADGRVRSVLAGLAFPVEDVLIIGGTHCDPENPSDGLCGLACGCSTAERQARYQQFLYLFLRDAIQAAILADAPVSYAAALDEAAAQGTIARTPAGVAR
jgi:pimeloyl-ACP methyl ester carboxylesterase